MTTQEKKDFILSRRNWLRTKTGRWALRKATGDVADTVAFRWDFMTVVNGRVCYAVAHGWSHGRKEPGETVEVYSAGRLVSRVRWDAKKYRYMRETISNQETEE